MAQDSSKEKDDAGDQSSARPKRITQPTKKRAQALAEEAAEVPRKKRNLNEAGDLSQSDSELVSNTAADTATGKPPKKKKKKAESNGKKPQAKTKKTDLGNLTSNKAPSAASQLPLGAAEPVGSSKSSGRRKEVGGNSTTGVGPGAPQLAVSEHTSNATKSVDSSKRSRPKMSEDRPPNPTLTTDEVTEDQPPISDPLATTAAAPNLTALKNSKAMKAGEKTLASSLASDDTSTTQLAVAKVRANLKTHNGNKTSKHSRSLQTPRKSNPKPEDNEAGSPGESSDLDAEEVVAEDDEERQELRYGASLPNQQGVLVLLSGSEEEDNSLRVPGTLPRPIKQVTNIQTDEPMDLDFGSLNLAPDAQEHLYAAMRQFEAQKQHKAELQAGRMAKLARDEGLKSGSWNLSPKTVDKASNQAEQMSAAVVNATPHPPPSDIIEAEPQPTLEPTKKKKKEKKKKNLDSNTSQSKSESNKNDDLASKLNLKSNAKPKPQHNLKPSELLVSDSKSKPNSNPKSKPKSKTNGKSESNRKSKTLTLETSSLAKAPAASVSESVLSTSTSLIPLDNSLAPLPPLLAAPQPNFWASTHSGPNATSPTAPLPSPNIKPITPRSKATKACLTSTTEEEDDLDMVKETFEFILLQRREVMSVEGKIVAAGIPSEAFEVAYRYRPAPHNTASPDRIKYLTKNISAWRNGGYLAVARDVVRSLVVEDPNKKRKISGNKKKVDDALATKDGRPNFICKRVKEGKRYGPYRSRIVYSMLERSFKKIAVERLAYRPEEIRATISSISEYTVALCCTALSHVLEEWKDGTHQPEKFSNSKRAETFNSFIQDIEKLKKTGKWVSIATELGKIALSMLYPKFREQKLAHVEDIDTPDNATSSSESGNGTDDESDSKSSSSRSYRSSGDSDSSKSEAGNVSDGESESRLDDEEGADENDDESDDESEQSRDEDGSEDEMGSSCSGDE